MFALVISAGALWLGLVIFDALTKVGNKALKSAHDLGTSSASRVRRFARHFTRDWVAISITRDFREIEVALADHRNGIQHLSKWSPPRIVVDNSPLPSFESFALPDKRKGRSEMNIAELERVRQLTFPHPTSVIRQIAERKCEFPVSHPRLPTHRSVWPDAITSLRVNPDRAKWDFISTGAFKLALVKWAYDVERAVVLKTNERIETFIEESEVLNMAGADANAWLAKVKSTYDADYEEKRSKAIARFQSAKEGYLRQCREESALYQAQLDGYAHGESSANAAFFALALRLVELPDCFSAVSGKSAT